MIPNLLVEDALESVDHRVRPDTPLTEVVDLMVRLQVGAVPVVGDRSEVLGMVTSGDALHQLMLESSDAGPKAGAKTGTGAAHGDELTARDVMTRAVMCVSEGQPLLDAAQMMLNKDVDQLPVAREGRLVGVVTRANVLRALHVRQVAALAGRVPS